MQMVMYAEVRPDGVWHKIGRMFQSALDDDLVTDRVCDAHDNILYQIFGYMANEDERHTPITPISELRGLPDDVGEIIGAHPYFQNGGFVSYVTLKEILDYKWDQTSALIGVIPERAYVRLKEEQRAPSRWNYGRLSSNAEIVTPFVMDGILEGNIERQEGVKYYVQLEYDSKSYRDLCEFFCNMSIPQLMTLQLDKMTTEDIRVVYSFIN